MFCRCASHARALMTLIIVSLASCTTRAQQQDPMTINGGSVLAMAGKNCVVVAMDNRFGSESQMVTVAPRHVLSPNSKTLVAFTGLEGDIQSLSVVLSAELKSRTQSSCGMFAVGGDGRRQVSPQALASLTSHILYSRRRSPYFVNPLVVGLRDDTPFLCGMDVIGAMSRSSDFACAGTASKSLYGNAEAMWRPDLGPQELIECCARAFQGAMDRDCLSGYGSVLYLLDGNSEEGTSVVEYVINGRND